jgi:hypothetical protein
MVDTSGGYLNLGNEDVDLCLKRPVGFLYKPFVVPGLFFLSFSIISSNIFKTTPASPTHHNFHLPSPTTFNQRTPSNNQALAMAAQSSFVISYPVDYGRSGYNK